MSRQYDVYLIEHRFNVYRGYIWMMTNIGEEELDDILPEIRYSEMMIQMKCHDASKDSVDEYDAYDRYFYGDEKGGPEVRKEFNKAFLMHIHRNPHHWQYWVLIHDDGADGDTRKLDPIDMPDNYILEMICDWWSFSWKKHLENEESDGEDLKEIFEWYNEHRDSIILSSATRSKVEKLLDILEEKLEEFEDVELVDSEEEEGDIDDPDGGVVVVGG